MMKSKRKLFCQQQLTEAGGWWDDIVLLCTVNVTIQSVFYNRNHGPVVRHKSVPGTSFDNLSYCSVYPVRYSLSVVKLYQYTHCKDKIPKFLNKYSQKRNIGGSVPISTFMCLWEIYISPRSVCLLCWRKYVDRSCDYINRSQTHECGNWGWGCGIPRKRNK
jgi:hypothetical protein